jgi:tetratricopeptide (TPR) repeat protein
MSRGGAFAVTLSSVLLLAVSLPRGGEAGGAVAPPLVGGEALRTALAGDAAKIDDDALVWVETRLASDSADDLALRIALDARMRRFRANGDDRELDAAEALLNRLGGMAGAPTAAAALALAGHDFPRAVEASRAAQFAADPGDPDGTLGRFDALWASGRYADAAEILPTPDDRPASAGWLSRRARLEDGLGDVDAARNLMERAVDRVDAYSEHDVVRAWARVELGHFSAHSGRPEAAVAQYLDALRLVPSYPAALEGLAWIAYGVDEDLHRAEVLFGRAIAAGAHLDVRLTRAEVLRAQGRIDEAELEETTFLREATRSDRALRMHLRPLALYLAEDPARLDEALAHAESDLALRADRMAWAVRGLVLARIGRTDEALADAERALAWGSPEPGVLELAGRIHLAAGEQVRGRRLLREALDGSAELGPVASDAIRTLLDAT